MRNLNVQEAIRLLQTHINDLQGNKDGAIELVKTTLETINKPGQLTRPRAESARTALLKALDTCDKIVDQVESSPLSDRVHLIGNYIYNLLLALTDHYPIRNANVDFFRQNPHSLLICRDYDKKIPKSRNRRFYFSRMPKKHCRFRANVGRDRTGRSPYYKRA